MMQCIRNRGKKELGEIGFPILDVTRSNGYKMILYIGILQCAPREWEKEIQTILPSFARNKYPPRCLRAINCGHERARVATRVDKYEEGTRGGTNRAEQRERERERERERW